ncbi:MAG: VWA domain-containing protein [Desulfocapsaceae bacterium]|nr:VWA domain-containing protein [Desulfocapsaceae bacterium]
MDYQSLHKLFHKQVYPSEPNEWDIEDALGDLEDLDEEEQRRLLLAIPTIWPISHSLSFSFLKEGARQALEFDQETLAEWLRRILSNYEEGGLKKARAYMAEEDVELVNGQKDQHIVRLEQHLSRLNTYARGISGLELIITEADRTYTDTETLYLPQQVDFFTDHNDNLLYYKLTIALLSCCIIQGSFGRHRFIPNTPQPDISINEQDYDVQRFFERFANPQCAQDMFQLVELYRAMQMLAHEFPGLMLETRNIRAILWELHKQEVVTKDSEIERFFAAIMIPEGSDGIERHPFFSLLENGEKSSEDSGVFELIYHQVIEDGLYTTSVSFYPFLDTFQYTEAQGIRERRIEQDSKEFASLLADLLRRNGPQSSQDEKKNIVMDEADTALIMPTWESEQEMESERQKPMLMVDNKSVDLPDELLEIINRIEADLGKVPKGYVSAAFGMAGKAKSADDGAGGDEGEPVSEFIPYDEWDYRRQGYRKEWCSLREQVIRGVRSTFVDRTLKKHRGPLMKIRRQFEMMNTREHFARRRRHGNDLDLDALIDSLGDQKAGLAPSEKLFVRLVRNERSISTLFLVDMSNSTEGWVGVAIKEALVLLCEAMEIVGDRYGIYGFSGMRRMRSEVFKIKDIAECYTDRVKERLAAISPKEYTRMGPPIRHMIDQFQGVDTRSRLLLMLTDGKPEDYDDYKGQYAIEDTRKALAEARGCGIHPYCITIDREAHDYLEHLFGRGNYTYVNNIEQLPARLSEIYRLLTK